MDFEDIKKNHGERRWISWEEEGYLISCVEKAEASDRKLREAIEKHKNTEIGSNYRIAQMENRDEKLYKALKE